MGVLALAVLAKALVRLPRGGGVSLPQTNTKADYQRHLCRRQRLVEPAELTPA